MDICHNYSEAAESIASSPAVISKHIAKVEKELGLRIFERASKSRPVELTPAGQELITYFHSIVGLYKQMSTRSAELRREGGGSLVVGYCPFIGNFHEAEMLTQFSLENPEISVRRRALNAPELVRALLSGTVNAIFLPIMYGLGVDYSKYGELPASDFIVEELFQLNTLTLGIPDGHPLAQCERITQDMFPLLHDETFFFSCAQQDTPLSDRQRNQIYQLLGFVNRTRAGQLAKGALIVMAVYLVANILNMRTVTWLLNSLLQVGLLTLVVLFQPEIRRALERMGQTDQWAYRFFNKNRYNDTSLKGAWRSAIIAICDAAERFSETKTGALIVLERNTNLSEIVRTGTPVNSAVNLEVLGTIFYEGTPLHDGAAIIEDGRIKAAGCVLPLSNNLDLGKDMGTRHRACLGIAENSDAIAIVVSEETGIISMAKNGVLMRHFDRQTLYTRLVDEMIPKETASEKSAAEGWKARGKRLLNWVNNKEEDEQQ